MFAYSAHRTPEGREEILAIYLRLSSRRGELIVIFSTLPEGRGRHVVSGEG